MTEPTTEQAEPQDLPQPSVAIVVAEDGAVHYASRTSPFVIDGLQDGSLREVDDAQVPTPGEDHDTGTPNEPAGDGPGDGQRAADTTSDGGGAGVPGAETGGRARKRN